MVRVMARSPEAVLDVAASAALRAPSVLNTQPWRWTIRAGALDLRADVDRRLTALDHDGRMLTISCGVALDHALIALRAEGYRADVRLLPDPHDPDLLATIRPVGPVPTTAEDFRRYQTTLHRHTDRRPFGPDPASGEALAAMACAAAGQGVHVHVVDDGQVPALAAAAADAAGTELADPSIRSELADWTHRRPGSEDGLATDVTVGPAPRPVPLRPSVTDGDLPVGPGDDSGARYLVLWGDRDGRRAWLTAGVALSEVLLAAAEHGVAVSPMTDLVEVAAGRIALRRLLGWQGHPYAVLRVGVPAAELGVPAAHRRTHDSVVDVAEAPR